MMAVSVASSRPKACSLSTAFRVRRSLMTVRISRGSPCSAAGPASGSSQDIQNDSVIVKFTVNKQVNFGQQVVLVGNAAELGGWGLADALPLAWSEGHQWSTSVTLPVGSAVEYKFVVADPDRAPHWESCSNRQLDVGSAAASLFGSWDQPLQAAEDPAPASGTEVAVEGASGLEPATAAISPETEPHLAAEQAKPESQAVSMEAEAPEQQPAGIQAASPSDFHAAQNTIAEAVAPEPAVAGSEAPPQQEPKKEQQPAKQRRDVTISAEAEAAVSDIIAQAAGADAAGPPADLAASATATTGIVIKDKAGKGNRRRRGQKGAAAAKKA